MANPLIKVQSALYGAPGSAAVDVTTAIQHWFDQQYLFNRQPTAFTLININPALFDIVDPAPGQTKTLTIAYSTAGAGAGDVFARGGQDGDNLSLIVAPLNSGEVTGAFYGAGGFGIDLTTKMIRVRHEISAWFGEMV
jgi:hypothetical protein